MMWSMTIQHNEGVVPEWTIGDRLGRALRHANMGVGEMADYLGVSRNTVGNYINDRRSIPRPTLMLWAMRTGVPLEWIADGTGDGAPTPPTPGKRDEAGLAALMEQKRRRSTGSESNGRYLPSPLVPACAA